MRVFAAKIVIHSEVNSSRADVWSHLPNPPDLLFIITCKNGNCRALIFRQLLTHILSPFYVWAQIAFQHWQGLTWHCNQLLQKGSILPARSPKSVYRCIQYFTLYLPLCGYILQMPRLIGTLPSMKLQFFTFPTSNILNAPLMDGICTQNRNSALGIKAPSRGCRTFWWILWSMAHQDTKIEMKRDAEVSHEN